VRVIGVEGTAWAASAALFEGEPTGAPEANSIRIESDAYEPDSGGIHPREAAEHMRAAIPDVIEEILSQTEGPIDAVAFSRGPGLGPCLRIAASAARALALTLEVPLVGVNHMLAHVEIGRYHAGFDAPLGLNASGANAHILGYHDGRYRILGETMDTGVGNALDKFTRHLGWSHPGGPKIEARSSEGSYLELPYVVKGLDFSFAGLASAAAEAVDDGEAVEDVCFSLQETVFAMLTEVAERALSLTGRSELVLGGGVAQNDRLQTMLAEMCASRDAKFFAPPGRFLRDNAGMIAVLGARMFEAGQSISVEQSAVDASFRPDQVAVSWHAAVSTPAGESDSPTQEPEQGAEATITLEGDTVRKRRLEKAYRHRELDERLRRERCVQEARLLNEARTHGVPTPVVREIDLSEPTLVCTRVGRCDLQDDVTKSNLRATTRHLATLHEAGIVHGDPTTRNVRVRADRVFLIDFGLGYYSDDVEDHAMDLHVLRQSLQGTVDAASQFCAVVSEEYEAVGSQDVLTRLRAIEGRGRYQA